MIIRKFGFWSIDVEQIRVYFHRCYCHLDLRSSFSPLGRSIVIHHAQADGTRFACGNIDYDGNTQVETYRAAFPNPPVQGDIILKSGTWSYPSCRTLPS